MMYLLADKLTSGAIMNITMLPNEWNIIALLMVVRGAGNHLAKARAEASAPEKTR